MRATLLRAALVAALSILAAAEAGRGEEPDFCYCTLLPEELPGGSVGVFYEEYFSIGYGLECRGLWGFTANGLPPGLTLTGNSLSGTPTTAGTFVVNVYATKASPICIAYRQYTLIIGSPTQILGVAPSSGPAIGGTSITVTGLHFSSHEALTIGGVYAIGVVVVSDTQLTAVTPALNAGTLNDVALPGVTPLTSGWMADFLDVPQDSEFHDSVESIFRAGITAGYGNGYFGSDDAVTRGEMAVFILKGEHGGAYTPLTCEVTVFSDEMCPGGPFVDWVNQIASEGITGGCGNGDYCPNDAISRGQTAVFLLKGEHGGVYIPPTCTATLFADEPCPGGPFVDWVNQLASEGITAGCGSGDYCPDDPVTRGEMAVLLTKTFGL
jgi:hypothetical protein